MDVTVYTANLGGFENLRPVPPGYLARARWLAYLDTPEPAPAGWTTVPAYQPYPEHDVTVTHPLPTDADPELSAPRVTVEHVHADHARNVRIHKLLPHEFAPPNGGAAPRVGGAEPDGGGQCSIWHDANFVLAEDPQTICTRLLFETGADIAVFPHPGRDCLYREAEIVARENIERRDIVEAQVARYRADRFPENWGLAACGFLVRRDSEKMREFAEHWWAEVRDFGRRDQIAFPYVAWKHGLLIHWIRAGSIWHNPLARRYPHAWERGDVLADGSRAPHPDNEPYLAERERRAARLARLRALAQRAG